MADSALVKEDEDSKEVEDSKEAEVGRVVFIGCCVLSVMCVPWGWSGCSWWCHSYG